MTIERQVIVTWYTPEEKMPEEGVFVVATVSGKGPHITYDHTLMVAEWYDDGEGWEFESLDCDTDPASVVVHAWCDLEPYGIGRNTK